MPRPGGDESAGRNSHADTRDLRAQVHAAQEELQAVLKELMAEAVSVGAVLAELRHRRAQADDDLRAEIEVRSNSRSAVEDAPAAALAGVRQCSCPNSEADILSLGRIGY